MDALATDETVETAVAQEALGVPCIHKSPDALIQGAVDHIVEKGFWVPAVRGIGRELPQMSDGLVLGAGENLQWNFGEHVPPRLWAALDHLLERGSDAVEEAVTPTAGFKGSNVTRSAWILGAMQLHEFPELRIDVAHLECNRVGKRGRGALGMDNKTG